jgi:hypothetical protein
VLVFFLLLSIFFFLSFLFFLFLLHFPSFPFLFFFSFSPYPSSFFISLFLSTSSPFFPASLIPFFFLLLLAPLLFFLFFSSFLIVPFLFLLPNNKIAKKRAFYSISFHALHNNNKLWERVQSQTILCYAVTQRKTRKIDCPSSLQTTQRHTINDEQWPIVVLNDDKTTKLIGGHCYWRHLKKTMRIMLPFMFTKKTSQKKIVWNVSHYREKEWNAW